MSGKILALDTATDACSVALALDDTTIERYEWAPRRHTAILLPMIEAVLAEADLSVGALDALAFGRGPGSFTGLRIAASVVQGIAFAADLPVVPISSLAAMARRALLQQNRQQAAVALDARRGEIYWGCYRARGDDVSLAGPEQVCAPASVCLPDGSTPWFGVGNGWRAYGELLRQTTGISCWMEDCYPRAGDIAALARYGFARAEWVSAEQALPVYLRNQVVAKPGHNNTANNKQS